MSRSVLLAPVMAALLALAVPAVGAQEPSSPAKKALVAKILTAQQPAVETMARQLVERPAAQLLQQAAGYVQTRVPQEERAAVARDLQEEARKYVDSTYPFVRERALKIAPTTVGPIMEQKMTEAELKEVLAIFESAAWRKFQGLGGEMQQALGQQLVADVKPQVETNMRALDQAVAKRLGIQPGAASAAGTGK